MEAKKEGGDYMIKKIKDFGKKVVAKVKTVTTKVLAVVGVGTAAVAVSRPAQAAWATSVDLTSVTADLYTVGGLVLGVGLVTYGFKRVKSFFGW